jgi:ABC-type transport system involved in multi-copper enzyme maturation permease subunit
MSWQDGISPRRRRQLWAIARAEIGRARRERGFLILVALALLPILTSVLRSILLPEALSIDIGRATADLATVLSGFHLRVVVFFTCALAMVRPFRSEVSAQTLHLSLLAPVRREVLAAGKFLGSFGLVIVLLLSSTLLTWVIRYLACGMEFGGGFILSGRGLAELAGYLLAVLVAVLGYAALFFAVGVAMPKPLLAIAGYLLFESAAAFIAPAQLISVRQWSRAFLPGSAPGSMSSLMQDPLAVPVALAALLAALVLAGAVTVFAVRRMEIAYGPEDE